MDFSTALEKMKQGYKLKRRGWNGANQYVTHEIKITIEDRDNNIHILSHQDCVGALIFHGNRGTQVWVPSHSDLLSEDWVVI